MADVEKQYIAVPSWKICIFEKVVPCFSGASVECWFCKMVVWNHIADPTNQESLEWESESPCVVSMGRMGSLILESWKIRAPDPGVLTIKMTTWTFCGWWRTCMYIYIRIYIYIYISWYFFLVMTSWRQQLAVGNTWESPLTEELRWFCPIDQFHLDLHFRLLLRNHPKWFRICCILFIYINFQVNNL